MIEEALEMHLAKEGFKKKGSTWTRAVGGVIQLVDLQKSNFGLQFYVNICCVPAGMSVEGMPSPKEHKCPIRIRLGAAYPNEKAKVEEALDLENVQISESVRQEKIRWLVNELIFPFLGNMRDNSTLKKAIEEGKFTRGGVDLATKQFLGIEGAT